MQNRCQAQTGGTQGNEDAWHKDCNMQDTSQGASRGNEKERFDPFTNAESGKHRNPKRYTEAVSITIHYSESESDPFTNERGDEHENHRSGSSSHCLCLVSGAGHRWQGKQRGVRHPNGSLGNDLECLYLPGCGRTGLRQDQGLNRKAGDPHA